MFESIKTKLWDLLKEKEVSLAMIYNREGEILWQKGRDIKGKTIEEGTGFSKSLIKRTLNQIETIEKENIPISSAVKGLPESAFVLKVKGLIIQPVSNNFYLYIDSGTKESFSKSDIDVFKVMGDILGEMIKQISKNEKDVGGITGISEEIKNIRELVLKYSLEEEPILLHGETGSGKSHIAKLIHRYSGRKGNFFTVNTPGIPENLFESEIFGHKKGAFTDAKSDKRGYVDEAKGGTLFFDEISEVPVSFQTKLLRFIETKKYNVLGESEEKHADVRIVAATNKDLKKAIKTKEFREDLYYRLNILEIEVPPIRNRREDIKSLVKENMKLLKGKEIGEGFWEAVYSHEWPGNVRELITILTRAGILLDSPITGKDIEDIIHQTHYSKPLSQQSVKMDQIWKDIMAGKSFWDVLWKPFINRDFDRNTVKIALVQAYNASSKNFKKMIKLLNLDESEYNKFMSLIHQYDISPKVKS